MTWEIGVTTGCCTTRPILDALEAAAAAGVRAIEIGTPPLHFDPSLAAQVEIVSAALGRLGLHAVSMHAPFGGDRELSIPPGERLDAALASLVAAADTLRRLGGGIMVVHPSDVPRHRSNPAERLHHAAAALGRLGGSCRELGIRVALETPLPHLIGGHPDEFGFLLTRLDGDVGVCLDTGHVHLGRHLGRFLDVAGPRLVHVHVHDNHGTHDDHLAPGEGSVDWQAVLSGLEAVHYRGRLMLELHCPAGPLAGHFSRAHRRLRELVEPEGR